MGYRITSDSTTDLSIERMQALNVPFCSLHLQLDGEDILDDMQPKTALRLYNAMREGKVGVTSQVTVDSFLTQWGPILKEGDDILYIGFSSGLSGTINSATLARSQLLEAYPERRIHIVDSLAASGGEGLLLEHAVMIKESGAGFDEAIAQIEAKKLHVEHWFTVDDLSYLRRGGRISGAAAFIASILSIKPVMHVNDEGKLIPIEKVKGRRGAIKSMFEKLTQRLDTKLTKRIIITNADCVADAEALKGMIAGAYPDIPVSIYPIGAVIGAHAGPGTLALFFLSGANSRQA